MPNEPEPTPYSAEDQLKVFKSHLDKVIPATRTLPGFLFRDWRDHLFEFSARELEEVDFNLLNHQAELYGEAMEIRDQLLDSIKPIEILDMVRDVWDGGNIKQKGDETALAYDYVEPTEEWLVTHNRGYYSRGTPMSGDFYQPPTTTVVKTGKWGVNHLEIKKEIGVRFGNSRFPNHVSTYTDELDEFFADRFPKGGVIPVFLEDYIHEPKGLHDDRSYDKFIDKPRFQGIPSVIWRRPDNLRVYVTVPYALLPMDKEGHFPRNNYGYMWFDQSVSQQDIMDYLTVKLEDQRKVGQLPSQVASLQLAKIEVLKRREVFKEGLGYDYRSSVRSSPSNSL